jgi:enamine deaminase RidA (YjgF/YER057c/UK114 family)
MAGQIQAKLAELGITLPLPTQPIANYVPYVVTGNLVFISGQIPAIDGKVMVTGKVSWGVSIDQAKEGARLCFINTLVHLKAACGWAGSSRHRPNSANMPR